MKTIINYIVDVLVAITMVMLIVSIIWLLNDMIKLREKEHLKTNEIQVIHTLGEYE